VAGAALALARASARAAPPARARPAPAAPGPGLALLAAAALAGAATLGFEVLGARAAALRLGSSLAAWALVLALFLAALALGNAVAARPAGAARTPARVLGAIEIAAAAALLLLGGWLVRDPVTPAAGLTAAGAAGVALALFPGVALMGAAFPFLVRLATDAGGGAGARFGALSAANTAGGIAGSLLAPFVLLPAFGLRGAVVACALAGAALGAFFLATAALPWRRRARDGALAAAALALAAGASALGGRDGAGRRLLFEAHGPQASVAVLREGTRRDLYVDGDAEASSGGAARATEEWLALLPLALHPSPARVFEVGLGSGITLGTAARFPLEEVGCVEIASGVLRAAGYFAPENGGIVARARRNADGSVHPPRVAIELADARTALLRERGRWDVVVANTVHPWSVGATGLYSVEYGERIRGALRPGGLAAQWLPLELPEPAFAALLRTWFAVFPHGDLWWGAGNVILLGAEAPLPAPDAERFERLRRHAPDALARLALGDLAELAARRVAGAEAVRAALGAGALLTDDRPRLELWSARQRAAAEAAGGLAVLERIAEEAAGREPGRRAIADFVASRAAHARGETGAAGRLEARAEAAGLGLARAARVERAAAAAAALFREGRLAEAAGAFRRLLAESPAHGDARFGLAASLYRQGDHAAARGELETLVVEAPAHAEAWNLLGALRAEAADGPGARHAFERALAADPWYPEALANAARLAEAAGDADAAARYRARQHRAGGPLRES